MKNDYDFLTFVMFEQHRLWQGTADHRRKSVRKAEKFSNFRDYGTRALNDFKPHDIHDFFDSLTREELSDNTVNHYAAMLTRVFNHAVNEEHITHAPKFTWKAVKTTLGLSSSRTSNSKRWRLITGTPRIGTWSILSCWDTRPECALVRSPDWVQNERTGRHPGNVGYLTGHQER